VAALLGASQGSRVSFEYTNRSAVKRVASSYGVLIARARFDESGLPLELTYGDAASTTETYTYNDRKWLDVYALTSTPAPTQQVDLARVQFTYDEVGNPTTIDDTSPAPWPNGAKPVKRTIQYDARYRVSQITSQYAQSAAYVSPFAAEVAAGDVGPMPLQQAATRVQRQRFRFDWKGNQVETTDDLTLLYDRSLGAIGSGEAINKPNQLLTAAAGGVKAAYDEAGNLIDLRVERGGTCTVAGQNRCAQRFVFDWDEIGQLVRARRWDYAGNSIPASEPVPPQIPTRSPTRDLSYSYSQGRRVVKSVQGENLARLHTIEVFDTLRLNHAKYDRTTREYERTPQTETAYLVDVARVVHDPRLPSPSGNPVHVFFELGDHLGSTAVVVDRETGEVAEKATYAAGGAAESDHRPARWNAFREDYRFTGKEEDTELGIAYFGARYYHPRLGTWLSPDPLSVHARGADLNPYAYVGGRLLSATDPTGLKETSRDCDAGPRSTCTITTTSPDDPTPEPTTERVHRDVMEGLPPTADSAGGDSKPPFDPYLAENAISRWLNTGTDPVAQTLRSRAFDRWLLANEIVAGVAASVAIAVLVAEGAGAAASASGPALFSALVRAQMIATDINVGLTAGGVGVGAGGVYVAAESRMVSNPGVLGALRAALGKIAQSRRVTAVLETLDRVLVGQGGAPIGGKQRAIAEALGAEPVRARILRFMPPGERLPHGEIQLLVRADFLGISLKGAKLTVDGAKICGVCQQIIKAYGGEFIDKFTVIFY
jgi:RHS repeat-associated protein